jgi:hypothetical protein
MTQPKPVPADQVRDHVRRAVVAQAKAKVRRKQVPALRKLGNGTAKRR